MAASVEVRVTEIVAEQLGVEKEKIKRESNFVNDLGADSLDTVELVMELEEEFDINIPDESAEKNSDCWRSNRSYRESFSLSLLV